jgi:glutamate carboxypeptidase
MTPSPSSALLDRALVAVRAAGPLMHELTRRWVELPSFTARVEDVNIMGQALGSAFAGLVDLELEVLSGGPDFGDHLVWRSPAALAGRPAVLLIGHHDTVFPPGSFEGWQAQDGRAVGPGALDMKGGLAVMFAAAQALATAGALADLPLVVVSVADEEVGSPSSRPHLEALARGAASALVFESGRAEDRIITRRKGTGALRVIMHGRAAHAGNDHQAGVNAILALARFIEAAQALTDYGKGVTVNVGTVRGGTSKNTVPASAECAVDQRYVSASDG